MLRLAILLSLASIAHAADEPAFAFTQKNDKDKVEATTKDGTTTFAVTSPGGIGNATIKRVGEKWPKAVVIRLNLRGLEGFDAAAGKTKMHAFVNTSSMKSVTFEKDGKAVEGYDAKHPLWTEIAMFNAEGKPTDVTFLNKGGYFEIALPSEFFDGNPDTLTLNWVDFYRR